MIKKIAHKDINREKYRACIQHAFNYRVYAEDWYLDCLVAKNWDCLVYNDYEAVLPLPFVKKMGMKFIIQPIFCQQLGVFSKREIPTSILNDFIECISNDVILSYQFNEENTALLSRELPTKFNFTLALEEYSSIYAQYRKDRKSDCKRIQKLGAQINRSLHQKDFIEELSVKYPHLAPYYRSNSFSKLLKELSVRDAFTYYQLLDGDEKVASLLIIHSQQRRILLVSNRNLDKKYKGALTYLLDLFIQENVGKGLILDFEGSVIPNIADYFQSFGAQAHHYHAISHSKGEVIRKLLGFK